MVDGVDGDRARVGDEVVATEVVAVGEGDTARRYVVSWTTT